MTNAPPETPNVSLGSIRNSVLPIILVFEPVCAGRHDDFIALLFTETIFAQNAAFVLDTFLAAAAAFRTLLCNELIGGEIGKVIKRLDARLAQRHQRGFGQLDRKTVVSGKRVSVLVDLGVSRLLKKKKK